MKVKRTLYMNRDKSENMRLMEQLLDVDRMEVDDETWLKFKHILYEVDLEVKIDTETGNCEILKVNGRELK
mgnify:FL=1